MIWSSTVRIALTGAAIMALTSILPAGTAQAADVLMERKPMAQVKAPRQQGAWAGPYVGSHYGWTRQNVDTSLGALSGDYDADGSAGGVLAGWMLQSGMFTYGIEADITIQETKERLTGVFPGNVSSDFIWNSSLRARAGLDFGRFMPFVSAGVAIAEMHQKSLAPPTAGDASTHVGWTAGAGIDIKIWEPQLIRLEYLYADYGSENYTFGPGTFRNDFKTHTIRGALIVQLDGNSEIKAPYFSQKGNWAGYYGGLVAGWTGSWADGTGPTGSFDYSLQGGGIGILAGTNWQWGSLVAGFDNDLTYLLGVKDSTTAGTIRSKILWSSHNRIRLGYDAGNFLPFIAGGLAITQHRHRRIGFNEIDFSPKWGWTLGAGVDFAIDDRLSARLEYLHDDMRNVDVGLGDGQREIDMPTETVRFGLTYRAGP